MEAATSEAPATQSHLTFRRHIGCDQQSFERQRRTASHRGRHIRGAGSAVPPDIALRGDKREDG